MEPQNWQLKNRIKYVENLRSRKFKEVHGVWYTDDNGRCVLGAYYPDKWANQECNISNIDRIAAPIHYFGVGCKIIEHLEMAESLGMNYLELRDIGNQYEGGEFPNHNKNWCLTHKQIADYIEEKHITPYIYMLGGKHLENYRQKIKEELKVLV